MSYSDAIALRVEWNNQGPFWHERTHKLLIRLCRQATPEWKQAALESSTFLEHYVRTAPSPYDNRSFDWHLSRLADGDDSLAFGFTAQQALIAQFGLDTPLYQKQFEALLSHPEFSIKSYLVSPLAASDQEVLYRRKSAELLDVVQSWEAFQRM